MYWLHGKRQTLAKINREIYHYQTHSTKKERIFAKEKNIIFNYPILFIRNQMV